MTKMKTLFLFAMVGLPGDPMASSTISVRCSWLQLFALIRNVEVYGYLPAEGCAKIGEDSGGKNEASQGVCNRYLLSQRREEGRKMVFEGRNITWSRTQSYEKYAI